MIQYIKGKGYTPRIWGSLSAKPGSTPVDWKDVEVDIWSIGWQRPADAIAQGAKIINITDIQPIVFLVEAIVKVVTETMQVMNANTIVGLQMTLQQVEDLD